MSPAALTAWGGACIGLAVNLRNWPIWAAASCALGGAAIALGLYEEHRGSLRRCSDELLANALRYALAIRDLPGAEALQAERERREVGHG